MMTFHMIKLKQWPFQRNFSSIYVSMNEWIEIDFKDLLILLLSNIHYKMGTNRLEEFDQCNRSVMIGLIEKVVR